MKVFTVLDIGSSPWHVPPPFLVDTFTVIIDSSRIYLALLRNAATFVADHDNNHVGVGNKLNDEVSANLGSN